MTNVYTTADPGYYAVLCDFEVLGYVESFGDAKTLLEEEKRKMDLFAVLKKSFVRKVLKGKQKLPSESKHFYIVRVIE